MPTDANSVKVSSYPSCIYPSCTKRSPGGRISRMLRRCLVLEGRFGVRNALPLQLYIVGHEWVQPKTEVGA